METSDSTSRPVARAREPQGNPSNRRLYEHGILFISDTARNRTHDLFCSKCVPIPTVLIECMIEFRSGRFGENRRNERLEIRGDGHWPVMFLDFLHLPCPGDNGHFYIASDRRQNHRDGLASTELCGLKNEHTLHDLDHLDSPNTSA